MDAPRIDVLVRGAGPVGCVLALALRDSALQVAMGTPLGGSAGGSFRPIALSYASRLILERVGACEGLPASAIETVHVSQQGAFGRTRLEARDAGVPALGYVVDYNELAARLREKTSIIPKVDAGVAARCVVHAEGASADADEKRYRQDAVVGLVRLAAPAGGTAHERFTPVGPLALLPMAGRYALVWSARPERAQALLELDEPRFLEALAAAAGRRAGVPHAIEGRALHPLSLRVRPTRIGERAVYIGNAAQTLHPVAGQGLNLGLRDAWDLAQILRNASDPGEASVLARYSSARGFDARATIFVTDLLAGGFTGPGGLLRAARGVALSALDVLPGPRRFFARRMIYGPSALP